MVKERESLVSEDLLFRCLRKEQADGMSFRIF